MWITIESVAVSASGQWQTLLLAWRKRDESLTWWWQDNHHSANGNLLFLGKASFGCSQRCTYRPSIFFFPHNYPLCWWSINLLQFIFYHSRLTDFEEKIEGLWTAQQANIFNNYAFKRYVWFSLHHFALWLSHSIFCICLRNCSPLYRDQLAHEGKTISVPFLEFKGKDIFFLLEWLKQKGLEKLSKIFES